MKISTGVKVPVVGFVLTAVFGVGFAASLVLDERRRLAAPTHEQAAPQWKAHFRMLQLVGTELLDCRIRAGDKACRGGGQACAEAREAVLGDGLFEEIKQDLRAGLVREFDLLIKANACLDTCKGRRSIDALLAAPLAVKESQ